MKNLSKKVLEKMYGGKSPSVDWYFFIVKVLKDYEKHQITHHKESVQIPAEY
jgi:hypothetical protein